jgi:hypothetical protein
MFKHIQYDNEMSYRAIVHKSLVQIRIKYVLYQYDFHFIRNNSSWNAHVHCPVTHDKRPKYSFVTNGKTAPAQNENRFIAYALWNFY